MGIVLLITANQIHWEWHKQDIYTAENYKNLLSWFGVMVQGVLEPSLSICTKTTGQEKEGKF